MVRVGSVVTIRARTVADQDVTIVDCVSGNGLHQLTTRTALGRALIGHRAGDEVKVETEAGTATFTVIRVRH
jgi:transcription elongation GreA/GreB family factor